MPPERTDVDSSDFIQFTTLDLVDELLRRSKTLVLAIELEAEGDIDTIKSDDSHNDIGLFMYGARHSTLGLAEYASSTAYNRMMKTPEEH